MSSGAAPAIESGLVHPRTAVFHSIHEDPAKISYITNTANVLSNRGLQVLLVDMDLYSPGLTNSAVAPMQSPGILEYLDERFLGNDDPSKKPSSLEDLAITTRFSDRPAKMGQIALLPAGDITNPRYFDLAIGGELEIMVTLPNSIDMSAAVSKVEVLNFRNFSDRIWRTLTNDIDTSNIEALCGRPDAVLVAASSGMSPLAWETISRFGANMDASVVSVVNSLKNPVIDSDHMQELLANAGIDSSRVFELDAAKLTQDPALRSQTFQHRCREVADFILATPA